MKKLSILFLISILYFFSSSNHLKAQILTPYYPCMTYPVTVVNIPPLLPANSIYLVDIPPFLQPAGGLKLLTVWVDCVKTISNMPITNYNDLQDVAALNFSQKNHYAIKYQVFHTFNGILGTIIASDDYILALASPKIGPGSPDHISLATAYPSPIKQGEILNIPYTVTEEISTLELNIYNVDGQLIDSQLNNTLSIGEHNLQYSIPSHISSGLYFYTLETDQGLKSKHKFMVADH